MAHRILGFYIHVVFHQNKKKIERNKKECEEEEEKNVFFSSSIYLQERPMISVNNKRKKRVCLFFPLRDEVYFIFNDGKRVRKKNNNQFLYVQEPRHSIKSDVW